MELTQRPAPPTGPRRLLLRLPVLLYRAHLGFLLGRRFVMIDHVGRVSGLPRQVVVEVVTHDRATDTVTVASGFGPRSDWYRNLRAHPDVTIRLGSRSWAVHAVALTEDEAGEVMVAYAHRHRWAARGLSSFMGFRVDGSDDDYRAVGGRTPMLRLDRVPGPEPRAHRPHRSRS